MSEAEQSMPDDDADCLHCYFHSAVHAWAEDNGRTNGNGEIESDALDVAIQVGRFIADLMAMAPDGLTAGALFTAVVKSAEISFPIYRERYRERRAAEGESAHEGQLEAAILTGKPN